MELELPEYLFLAVFVVVVVFSHRHLKRRRDRSSAAGTPSQGAEHDGR